MGDEQVTEYMYVLAVLNNYIFNTQKNVLFYRNGSQSETV